MGSRFCRALLSLLITVFASGTARAEIPGFSESGLRDRIAFWEKVFTEYGGEDLIIHDSERVHLIYDVVREDSRRSGLERVQRLLDEVRRQVDTPEQLSADARRLYDLIEATGVSMTAGNIATLRGRIHIQRGIRERFRDGIVRSGRYLDYFQEVFEREGVPIVIALLPLVESSFENSAYSSAGAAGIWQFTRSTGRQYMTISGRRDDRLDPATATLAAARLLRGNFDALGEWPLAITAYNHGRAGMQRAQRAHGSDMATIIREYDGRTFGYASKNFYAEFIAAVNVYERYAVHFGPLAVDAPLDFSQPATRTASIGPTRVAGGVEYSVRPGDTLSLIAARNGTSVQALRSLNRLSNDMIFAGETLLVGIAADGGNGEYRVRPGDTLSEIASAHGMSVADLRALNNLSGDTIISGSSLIVSAVAEGAAGSVGEYEVRRGDTLGAIARRFGIEIRHIMELNGLRNTQIFAGQTLLLR